MKTDRRSFLSFLGKSSIALMLPPLLTQRLEAKATDEIIAVKGILPSDKDQLILAGGMKYEVLIKRGDKLNDRLRFGFNNDFNCFIPHKGTNDGVLWTNHEYTNPLFVSGYNYRISRQERTKEQVDAEMKTVGGSLVRVRKIDGKWSYVPGHPMNRRLDGFTKIPFNWYEPILGANSAMGTLANCSGGLTPWGTILTCEENYDMFYGETKWHPDQSKHKFKRSHFKWERFYKNPPEHYGWVVEVDPMTGDCQKLIALGRFARECCTVHQLADGRVVAYSGEDSNDEFVYKFIGSQKNSLSEGTLYAADTIKGCWLSLDYNEQPLLRKYFKNQTDVLIRTRDAARVLGATPQNRPEDIEIDPLTGNILIAMTNNKPKGDYHGHILKIVEKDGNYESLEFDSEIFKAGGVETGFSCPDNMVFDAAGNLWFTSDISGGAMNNPSSQYMNFKNNGLFVLIRKGNQAGEIIQVASAPIDAEFTGPWFTDDYQTLFLSVQHPGETSPSLSELTSTWPEYNQNTPKSSVVTISGPLLNHLNSL